MIFSPPSIVFYNHLLRRRKLTGAHHDPDIDRPSPIDDLSELLLLAVVVVASALACWLAVHF